MKKINVNYIAFVIQDIVILLVCILMLIIPSLLFERNPDQWLYEILWYSMFSVFIVILSVAFLLDFQIAELTEKSITIKSVFGVVKSIQWENIYDIRIESVITGTAGARLFSKDWIVVYTESNQFDAYIKPNRKKRKGPWYIAATEKNIKIMKDYMNKYVPHILPIEP